MKEPLSFRDSTLAAIFCLLLIVSFPLATNAANTNVRTSRIINLRGLPVPSVYYGLKSDARFAVQLKALAKTVESTDGTRAVVFRKATSQCPVVHGAAFRLVSYPLPPGHPCYGQYMQPQWYDCGDACDPGIQYQVFYNNGPGPHNGYYLPPLLDECNGCELYEAACYNP